MKISLPSNIANYLYVNCRFRYYIGISCEDSNYDLGPQGIPIKKLTISWLEPRLLELLEIKEYKLNAERVAKQMKAEEFIEKLVKIIEGDYE
jgi:hypothetical protein